MQSRLCGIVALLLVCGAQGLHVAEAPAKGTKLVSIARHLMASRSNSTKAQEKTEEEITAERAENNLDLKELSLQEVHAMMHDFQAIFNASIPKGEPWTGAPQYLAFENLQLIADFCLKEKNQTSYANKMSNMVIHAAYYSLLGALDTYPDFETWWKSTLDAHSKTEEFLGAKKVSVTVDEYAKELLHLLQTEAPISGYANDTFVLEQAKVLANITGINNDITVTKDNVREFWHSLDFVGCTVAMPTGGSLPKRACVLPEQGASAEAMRLAPPVWFKLDQWLNWEKTDFK